MIINSELEAKFNKGLQHHFGYNIKLVSNLPGRHGETQPAHHDYMAKNDRPKSRLIVVRNTEMKRTKFVNGETLEYIHSPFKTGLHELVHAFQLENYEYEDWYKYQSGKAKKQNYIFNELVANTVAALIMEDYYNHTEAHKDNAGYINYYKPQIPYAIDYDKLEKHIDKYYNLVANFVETFLNQ